MSALFVGVEALYRATVGEPSEYFNWWVPVLTISLGLFLLLRYRSDQVQRLSQAVERSPYYKAFWLLIGLGSVGLGIWLAVAVRGDIDSTGARGVLGLAILIGLSGLFLAGSMFRDLQRT